MGKSSAKTKAKAKSKAKTKDKNSTAGVEALADHILQDAIKLANKKYSNAVLRSRAVSKIKQQHKNK